MPIRKTYKKALLHSVFFIRTSNFGVEAERSYIFLRFEPENVLKAVLNYLVYTTCTLQLINVDVTRKPIQVHCLLRYGIYLDNTSDFVSPDDFDDVEVILEQL